MDTFEHNAPASNAIVQLDGIGKVFATDEIDTHALRDVSLDVQRGDWVSIEGPSGSGKSTLLSVLGLLDAPSSGHYRLAGTPVDALDIDARADVRLRQIGFVFQQFNLIADLTVGENVALPLTYRGIAPAERDARVADALERVGLAHRAKHYPSQLSGGQQQRAAVARAVAGDPVLLLADEPTGNLDSASGDAVMALLSELHADGATLIMVTHDARYASRAHRTISLFDGTLGAYLDTTG